MSLAFLGRERDRPRGRPFLQVAEAQVMTKPRIHILALGGTIATRPDASGAMQMGLGADDLVAAVPLLKAVAEIEAETVSQVGSHSLSFDQIHALAAKIRGLKADGVVVTQGTDTLEETSFLLDLLLDLDIPVIVTAAMRNPALDLAGRAGQPAGRREGRGRSVGAQERQGAGRARGDARRGLCRRRRAQGPSDADQRLRLDPDRPVGRAGRGPRRAVRLPVRDAVVAARTQARGGSRQGRACRAVLDVARRRGRR